VRPDLGLELLDIATTKRASLSDPSHGDWARYGTMAPTSVLRSAAGCSVGRRTPDGRHADDLRVDSQSRLSRPPGRHADAGRQPCTCRDRVGEEPCLGSVPCEARSGGCVVRIVTPLNVDHGVPPLRTGCEAYAHPCGDVCPRRDTVRRETVRDGETFVVRGHGHGRRVGRPYRPSPRPLR
jgi:hypothetical protein